MKFTAPRAFLGTGVFALTLGLLTATPAAAWGNGWDWCSKVSMKTSGKAVTFRGNCDGGRLNLTGTWRKRSGDFDFRGSLGHDRVALSGTVNNLVLFRGTIDGLYVDLDGSEFGTGCVINGWIGDDFDNGHYGSLIGRMCSLMAYN